MDAIAFPEGVLWGLNILMYVTDLGGAWDIAGHGNGSSHGRSRKNHEGERREAFNALLWDLMTPMGLILKRPAWCDSCWCNGLGRCPADLMTGHPHPVTLPAKMDCTHWSLHSLVDPSTCASQWNLLHSRPPGKTSMGALQWACSWGTDSVFGAGVQPPRRTPPFSPFVQSSSFPCFNFPLYQFEFASRLPWFGGVGERWK